jgi:hypothetical protein
MVGAQDFEEEDEMDDTRSAGGCKFRHQGFVVTNMHRGVVHFLT